MNPLDPLTWTPRACVIVAAVLYAAMLTWVCCGAPLPWR